MRSLILTFVGMLVLCHTGFAGEAAVPSNLTKAPTNKWVKIGEIKEKIGTNFPILYSGKTRRFVMVGGGIRIRELDLAAGTWQQVPLKGKPPKGRGGYFQSTCDSDTGKIFTYWANRTLTVDTSGWQLTDLKASPSPAANPECLFKEREQTSYTGDHSQLIWGSLCYDPVNKEVLSVGGSSSSPAGTPGVWIYSVAKNAWRRGEFGDAETKKLRSETAKLGEECWTLVSLARNRFYVSETPDETKADLAAEATRVASAIDKLAGTTEDARASGKLKAAATELRKTTSQLKGAINAGTLETLTAARRLCFDAACVLAAEPPARANSQMAYDASQKKIVLFGGDGLDRFFGDTWEYDCTKRVWQQRFPKSAPRPRAGHALLYLPKSKRVLLIGGYQYGNARGGYGSLGDMWAYDTQKNEWSLITPAGVPRCAPVQHYHKVSVWPAAANKDDVVVMVDAGSSGPGKKTVSTWACRVDTSSSKVAAGSGGQATVLYRNGPFEWDKVAKPDANATLAKIKNLKPNVWTQMPTPKGPIQRDWGTTAYDPERHQFLYWGGGHSSYMGTDVNHYSLRSGLWSQSYTPGIAINFASGFIGPGLVTFQNRPFIPVHAYQQYAYDPVSDLMVACFFHHNFTYDVRRREWTGKPFRPPFRSTTMRVSAETTPRGLIAWTDKGMFLFDGKKRAWKKLPLTGKPGTPYGDASGMCYDSKRDCLWLGYRGDSISKYDIKTGVLSSKFTGAPATLKKWSKKGRAPTIREMTYVADQDLVLFMPVRERNGKSVNSCFDPKDGKWYWLELPHMTAKGEVKPRVGRAGHNGYWWSSAMNFDPEYKVVLLSNPVRRVKGGRIWLLKLDRKTVKMEEIK